jgi:acetyl-CoA synthetase
VAHEIGPVAKPRHVLLVPDLPKTRSGKIMRRLLAQILDGSALGDVTSLQNPWAVDQIAALTARRTVLPAAATRNAEEPA